MLWSFISFYDSHSFVALLDLIFSTGKETAYCDFLIVMGLGCPQILCCWVKQPATTRNGSSYTLL